MCVGLWNFNFCGGKFGFVGRVSYRFSNLGRPWTFSPIPCVCWGPEAKVEFHLKEKASISALFTSSFLLLYSLESTRTPNRSCHYEESTLRFITGAALANSALDNLFFPSYQKNASCCYYRLQYNFCENYLLVYIKSW